ncbi:MAG: NUDIX domain-containing protein [Pseudomonadota bacterium]
MHKVCAVIVRRTPRGPQVLVFRHPLAGIQLAKGTRLQGESPWAGARRELFEESGVTVRATPTARLGPMRMPGGTLWHIFAAAPRSTLPDRWDHWVEDDGGHLFSFHWHPLTAPPPASMGSPSRRVLRRINRSQVRIAQSTAVSPHPT